MTGTAGPGEATEPTAGTAPYLRVLTRFRFFARFRARSQSEDAGDHNWPCGTQSCAARLPEAFPEQCLNTLPGKTRCISTHRRRTSHARPCSSPASGSPRPADSYRRESRLTSTNRTSLTPTPRRCVMNVETSVTETVVRNHLQAFLEQKGVAAIVSESFPVAGGAQVRSDTPIAGIWPG